MMTSLELNKVIRDFCLANANEERRIKSQHYFKEPIECYGLTADLIYKEIKELLALKELTTAVVLESLPALFIERMHEEITIALLLLDGLHKQYTKETFKAIDTLFSMGIDNWAHADGLGMYILPKFIKQNIVDISEFNDWMNSPYKFQRRTVPVTFIKPMKAKKEVSQFIEMIKPLMTDKEREVQQGLGWFLREAWKIQRVETETFLLEWKDTAPRLIIQYACEKMTQEEKTRFKRNK
jgi:3-methyladenine DNA glycosylase AlkD